VLATCSNPTRVIDCKETLGDPAIVGFALGVIGTGSILPDLMDPPRRLSVPSTEHVNGSSAMCSAIWGGVDEIECGTFKYLSAVTRMDSVRSRGLCVVPRTPPCARIATSAGARYRGHLHHIGVGRRYAGSCMTEDRCFQIDDRIVHVTHVLTTASTQGFA